MTVTVRPAPPTEVVYTESEIDAIVASLDARLAALENAPPATTAIVPSSVWLFGPVQEQAALSQASPNAWTFPGTALSASTRRLRFDLGYAQVAAARWMVIWTPNTPNNVVRLVHFDDGPLNIVEIARVNGVNGGTPVPAAVDVTSALQSLVDGGVAKHIGFQVWGDNVSQWSLYECSIELDFRR